MDQLLYKPFIGAVRLSPGVSDPDQQPALHDADLLPDLPSNSLTNNRRALRPRDPLSLANRTDSELKPPLLIRIR